MFLWPVEEDCDKVFYYKFCLICIDRFELILKLGVINILIAAAFIAGVIMLEIISRKSSFYNWSALIIVSLLSFNFLSSDRG